MEKWIHGAHREFVDWHDADGPLRAPMRFEAGHIPSLFCEKEYKP
jgi:hypothetical protein